eukprot:1088633-Prorocentrum_minimum.AAC.1
MEFPEDTSCPFTTSEVDPSLGRIHQGQEGVPRGSPGGSVWGVRVMRGPPPCLERLQIEVERGSLGGLQGALCGAYESCEGHPLALNCSKSRFAGMKGS